MKRIRDLSIVPTLDAKSSPEPISSQGLAAPGRRWFLLSPRSPLRTLVILLGIVGLIELGSEMFLRGYPPPGGWGEPVTEIALIVVVVFPALWFLVFRPMRIALAERRRVERGLKRKTRELEALAAVTQAASRHLDADWLLAEVVDEVLPVFEADGAWVVAFDDVGGRGPRAVAGRGIPDDFLKPELALVQANCPACRGPGVCASPPMSTPSIAGCQVIPRALLTGTGFRQHVGVVLPVGGKVGVILNLVWREKRVLDEGDERLLRAIGTQVGVALENARLYRAEMEARREADTLRSASLAITRSLDLDEALGALFDHLGRLVPYERAKVMLLEGESRLRVRAVFSPTGRADFPGRPLGSFDVENNPALAKVLRSRQACAIADTRLEPVWAPQYGEAAERSWLGVPLTAGGRALGLYSIVRAAPGGFTAEEVHLAEALAAPTSVAVSNTLLFRELETGRERLSTLSRNLVEVQEDERKRIARELHDEAGQSLTSLRVGLRLIENHAGDPDAVGRRTAELREVVDRVQEDLHRLAADLRPASIDQAGLAGALGSLATGLSKEGGSTIEVETPGLKDIRLPPELEVGLYRIAQEAVTNAVQHAAARHISVVVSRRDGRCVLVVEDDGRGMELEKALGTGRLGLVGMRERTEMMGGSLLVETSPGAGTTVVVEVPHAG